LSHFGLHEALAVVKELKARHNYFIGMTHSLEHSDLERRLQIFGDEHNLSVRPAYDTLKVDFLPRGQVKESTWRENDRIEDMHQL
jgi:hypothetical protein